MKIKLLPDDVGALVARLPMEARQSGSGITYDGTNLDVPRDYEVAVRDILAVKDWKESAPAQDVQRRLTFLEFMGLFTQAEQDAIADAARQSTPLFLWMIQAAGAAYIDLDDERTAAGVSALSGSGLISATRAKAVIAGRVPS